MNSSKKILGVVVCGGESKRMGSDKGLMLSNGTTWVQLAAAKLKELNIPVVISINPKQQEAYSTLFIPNELLVDNQQFGGPLKGLFSVHAKYNEHDLLLMACDMIDMQQPVLKQLIQQYELNAGFEFYAYEVNKVVQPFCAIYTSEALRSLEQNLSDQRLEKSSVRYLLEHGNTFRIQDDHATAAFNNYNTRDVLPS